MPRKSNKSKTTKQEPKENVVKQEFVEPTQINNKQKYVNKQTTIQFRNNCSLLSGGKMQNYHKGQKITVDNNEVKKFAGFVNVINISK